MEFLFYPRLEHGYANVGHCPHLGGASLSMVVSAANENSQSIDMLHGQLAYEREAVGRLVAQNAQLQQQLEQARRELRAERQRRFTKDRPEVVEEPVAAPLPKRRKKCGAPVGHPGRYRPQPTAWNRVIEVAAPKVCPHCGGAVREHPHRPSDDHLQEDVVDGRRQVILYRHAAARCRQCRLWVRQAGEGELLGKRIGPHARAMAAFLHNEIGVSARKVPRAIEGLTGLRFTLAAFLEFEAGLDHQAQSVVQDILAKISSTEHTVHADETYWSLDGKRAFFWIHATGRYVHFHCSRSRAGKVSRRILGDHFAGILVTDCYAGYDAQPAQAKQKCLAHLTRTARDWQQVVPEKSLAWKYFEKVKSWVTRACRFHRRRNTLDALRIRAEIGWIRNELQRLLETETHDHDRTRRLQKRLRRYATEWLTFLDRPETPPTNNHAEMLLRSLVILRKITFGHRSEAGARRTARLMTVMETAKRHGHRVLDIYYRMAVDPPDRVLRHLYSGP